MGFGDSRNVSPTVVDFAESMIRSTPTEVIADFYPALMSHDKLTALHVLDDVPTAIMVGDKDWLTPPEHSKAIAAALPRAQLTEVPDTSHLIQLERPGRGQRRAARPDQAGGAQEDDAERVATAEEMREYGATPGRPCCARATC